MRKALYKRISARLGLVDNSENCGDRCGRCGVVFGVDLGGEEMERGGHLLGNYSSKETGV